MFRRLQLPDHPLTRLYGCIQSVESEDCDPDHRGETRREALDPDVASGISRTSRFGPMMKYAGCDPLVFTGRAKDAAGETGGTIASTNLQGRILQEGRMSGDKKETISCHRCKTLSCMGNYAQGIPKYCRAGKFKEVIDESIQEYFEPEIAKVHLATARVLKRGGFEWTRVQQCIEFALETGATKVGLAVCIACIREGRAMANLLEAAGLEVVTVGCMIGAAKPQDTGIPDALVTGMGIACNPLAQAKIMNEEGTQLNFIYGLCVGHDTLFINHSEAPVSYVATKDAVTGDNASAALKSAVLRLKLAMTYQDAGFSPVDFLKGS